MKRSNTYLNTGLLIAALVFVAGSVMAGPPPPPPVPTGVPDAGSTSLLLGISAMGLAAIKRAIRR